MEKLLLRSLFLLSVISLASCSGVEPGDDPSGIDSNTSLSSTFTTYDSTSISGSGKIRFNETLSLFSNKSLTLKASLDDALSTSSVAAVFYTSNMNITVNDGIVVTFVRDGSSVDVKISYNGNEVSVFNSRLSFYYPASLDVIVEVHNSDTKARVLIWRRDAVEYSTASADVDTNKSDHINGSLPTERGAGAYVGLILTNSTVTAARLDSQKVLE